MAKDQSSEHKEEERQGAAGWRRRSNLINLMEIETGAHISLPDDAIGVVVDNPRDGSWIIAKYVESPQDPAKVGQEEPIFAEDVLGIVEKA